MVNALLWFVLLGFSNIGLTVARYRTKLTYEKDMSEYCRRRAVPSVFLGRHVQSGNSQVLRFTQLDLPYSCFISVRAESGSDIILVIQMVPNERLDKICEEERNQLVVYELGETFGGYWAPLPEKLIKESRDTTKFYTLPTTTTTTEKPDNATVEEEQEEVEVEVIASSVQMDTNTEYPEHAVDDDIQIVLPLLNVSGHLVASDEMIKPRIEIEGDKFDMYYDVAQKKGESYDTTIVPIVQFSMATATYEYEKVITHRELINDFPYKLHHLTVDDRLTYQTPSHRLVTRPRPGYYSRYKPYANKLYKFNKNRTSLHNIYNSYLHSKRKLTTLPEQITSPRVENEDSIQNVLNKYYHKTLEYDDRKEESLEQKQIPEVLKGVSNMKHNKSAYLLPSWLSKNKNTLDKTRLNSMSKDNLERMLNHRLYSIMGGTNDIKIKATSKSTKGKKTTSARSILNSRLKNNTKSRKRTTEDKLRASHAKTSVTALKTPSYKDEVANYTRSNPETTLAAVISSPSLTANTLPLSVTPPTVENVTGAISATQTDKVTLSGSLVNHKSWENIVQVAPEMADHLNGTVDNTDKLNALLEGEDLPPSELNIREKRYVKALRIEDARPSSFTAEGNSFSSTEFIYYKSDAEAFAGMVELEDDEFQGRLSLRYLGRYVSPELFKLCNYTDAIRHVYLFNASRIVLALRNFTMHRMILTMTPAKTIKKGTEGCPYNNIECQVAGARVCIDSMSACDGIPNCGAYDVYDEDRMLCGGVLNLQHNVYLASFTFMAVLLTAVCAVHYWLKRCVPQVSDAFFIYTYGTENILYLDTIMRSPHAVTTDEGSRIAVYHSALYNNDIDIQEPPKQTVKGMIKEWISICCCGKVFKPKISEDILMEDNITNVRRLYSFTQMELGRMFLKTTSEAGTQTGDSFDMEPNTGEVVKKVIRKSVDMYFPNIVTKSVSSTITMDEMLSFHKPRTNELDLMKLLNNSKRSPSTISTLIDAMTSTEEEDVVKPRAESMEVEKEIQTTLYELHESSSSNADTGKITTVPEIHLEPRNTSEPKKQIRFEEEATMIPAENDDDDESRRRQVTVSGKNMDSADNDEHATTSKDFRRFWSPKGKKTKKKSVLH